MIKHMTHRRRIQGTIRFACGSENQLRIAEGSDDEWVSEMEIKPPCDSEFRTRTRGADGEQYRRSSKLDGAAQRTAIDQPKQRSFAAKSQILLVVQ